MIALLSDTDFQVLNDLAPVIGVFVAIVIILGIRN